MSRAQVLRNPYSAPLSQWGWRKPPSGGFNVLDTDDNPFVCALSILDTDDNPFAVGKTVLDTDDNPFVVS